jgi:formylglycine-generating enzyme required for sulfatase activity
VDISDGPAPVGSHPGLGDYGTYDMAGNVKEWAWNETEGRRYVLGGEPTYPFKHSVAAPPLEPPGTERFPLRSL